LIGAARGPLNEQRYAPEYKKLLIPAMSLGHSEIMSLAVPT